MPRNDIALPPQTIRCERGALCCALVDSKGADALLVLLEMTDFYLDTHQIMYSIISTERMAGRGIDPVLMAEMLYAKGAFGTANEAGDFVAEIVVLDFFSHNLPGYAYQVREMSKLRKADQIFKDGTKKIHVDHESSEEVIASSIERLQAALGEGSENRPQSALDTFFTAINSFENRSFNTGFRDLDRITHLEARGLHVIGARPSTGKTSLALAMAQKFARSGYGTFFWSLEMSKRDLIERMVASTLNLDYLAIRDNHLSESDRSRVLDMQHEEWLKSLIIDDEPRTVEEMGAILRLMIKRNKIQFFLVDYLQLIEPSNMRQPREQQVADITRKLKKLVKKLGISGIVLAQLNREIDKREHKAPRVSDLRESGSIEQDADQVWLLWRPNKDTDQMDDIGEVIVGKSRNGPLGSARLFWHGPTMSYSDFPERDQQDRFD